LLRLNTFGLLRTLQTASGLLKAGGKADVITLDSEISADVDQAAKDTKLKRNKILLEAIRTGLQPFISRTMSEKMSLANVQEGDP
jgi:predicted transcriptional regulator